MDREVISTLGKTPEYCAKNRKEVKQNA